MTSKPNAKRMTWLGALFSLALVVGIISVSEPANAQIGFPGEETKDDANQELDKSLEATIARGKAVYDGKCAFCHRADGKGVPASFPPLVAGTKFEAAPKIIDPLKERGLYENGVIKLGTVEVQINVVLKGIPGTRMFAFESQLTTQQAADVVTYIRNAWSNNSGDLVTPAQIEAASGK